MIFTVVQGLIAVKAGATFISPFLGRLDDIGGNSIWLIHQLRTIIDQFGFETEIISASIRGLKHVEETATAGSHIATIPTRCKLPLYKH